MQSSYYHAVLPLAARLLLAEATSISENLIRKQPALGYGQVLTGQLYVEKLIPQRPKKKYPLVFIPGGGQTSTNFQNTPDGREGWASYFLRQGYTIYLTDPPQRGRSPWVPGEGTVGLVPVDYVLKYFTTLERYSRTEWPQAPLHTQWPGTGLLGDPTFDAFYASQVQLQTSAFVSEDNAKLAYNALLDRIGPAVLVTHSQAGPYGWVAADSRPNLVKGIIAVEPEGPPFVNQVGPTGPPRVDGITRLPLLYDPPVTNITRDLKTVKVPPPEGKQYTSCTIQAEPARKLVNLQRIRVLLITGEASYHAAYDYCFVKFFEQTGVPLTWLDLGSEGVHGNGHFLFLEKNSLQIAGLVAQWLRNFVD
ncbi:MAG: hypothetical protein Q9219_003247 [cf. Caloplaca sp. 3 TL-2023]